ncbi:MAG: hypothetical protein HRU10_13635 [Opitutales bacterium]|nr:hypothetical protein [Opitutales bacterium]
MSVQGNMTDELDYTEYEARQRFEITEAGMRARMPSLGIGGRARWIDGRWEPQPYPGYAFQAMVKPYPENSAAFLRLVEIRDALCASLGSGGDPALFPLPEDSFHQTVISTFSAGRLEKYVTLAGLTSDFPDLLARHIPAPRRSESLPSVKMRMIGVSLFRTAIGILGTFDEQADFQRVVALRHAAYQNDVLNKIGLERTRPFIGHATLAYLERPLAEEEKAVLIGRILKINRAVEAEPMFISMPEARLHRYDTLAEFFPDPAYPAFKI